MLASLLSQALTFVVHQNDPITFNLAKPVGSGALLFMLSKRTSHGGKPMRRTARKRDRFLRSVRAPVDAQKKSSGTFQLEWSPELSLPLPGVTAPGRAVLNCGVLGLPKR